MTISGRLVRHLMGTTFSLHLDDPVPASAVEQMWRWLAQVEAVFSTYRAGSDISLLDRGLRRLDGCHPDVADVLDQCARWQRRTGGRFSATARGRLDPSGLVKGWAIERASAMLAAAGSTRHYLCGGGDVRLRGGPWVVGVADPHHPDRVVEVVTLTDAAIATSGTSARGAHVVNPLTGRPPRRLCSVSVVAGDLITADVWATALLAGDAFPLPDRELAALALTGDGRVDTTASWPCSSEETVRLRR